MRNNIFKFVFHIRAFIIKMLHIACKYYWNKIICWWRL